MSASHTLLSSAPHGLRAILFRSSRHSRHAMFAVALSTLACGSRTMPEEPFGTDVGVVTRDAGRDASILDVVLRDVMAGNAARDVGFDVPPKPSCESATILIDQLRPTVTLLVDQSASMSEAYPTRASAVTRWSLVQEALLHPETGVIRKLQLSIRFGIVFFTSHNGSTTGTCPLLSEVRAATNNFEAIRTLYGRMSPDDDTPTGDSIDKVVEAIDGSPSGGPQTILLVTDGLPDSCAVPDPQLGQADAVSAAQRAHRAGIDLTVLGISADIAGENLQELANAGKGRPITSVWGRDDDAAQPFQASESVAGLTAQFTEILERIPFCEVRLRRDVLPSETSTARVELDGRRLTFDDTEGFLLRDARRLEIVGNACEAIKSGGKQLLVRIGCD